mgnify:CR=1 FL=1
MTQNEITLRAIAADLDLCDVGEALTSGKLRAKYRRQRRACMVEIARINREDGLGEMTTDQILAELEA